MTVQCSKETKEILNKEFDDMLNPVKWSLEDLVEQFEKFRPIFNSNNEADKVKQYLTETLKKIRKL